MTRGNYYFCHFLNVAWQGKSKSDEEYFNLTIEYIEDFFNTPSMLYFVSEMYNYYLVTYSYLLQDIKNAKTPQKVEEAEILAHKYKHLLLKRLDCVLAINKVYFSGKYDFSLFDQWNQNYKTIMNLNKEQGGQP